MSEKPLKQWLNLEVWEDFDGTFTYTMGTGLEDYDENEAADLILHVAHGLQEMLNDDSPLVFGLTTLEDGTMVLSHPKAEHSINSWTRYKWFRETMYIALWRLHYVDHEPSRLVHFGWYLSWLWNRLVGRIKPSLSTVLAAAPTPAGTPGGAPSEPSTGLPGGSPHSGGNVITFPGKRR